MNEAEKTISERLWDAMPQDLRDYWEKQARRRDGEARLVYWDCEDGWTVGYSTTRVEGGGELDGRFAVFAYKPIGKGARGGKKTAREWKLVYRRGFAKRKLARARAEVLFYRHSPKRAERDARFAEVARREVERRAS